MITFEHPCLACKKPFRVEVLEPPEPRFARCPDCGAPHYFEFKQKQIIEPGRFAPAPGVRH